MIEAIVEELPPKRELFAELDRITRPDAILATNTSALSVSQIAEAAERPERVIGMHFFNPAPLLPLVEIVRAERSSDEAVDAAYAWAERAGKQPVRCNDTPGFIVNRVLIPLLNDCVRVLDEAGVTPEDLDKAMTNGAGWPMGPCELVDLVGIDIHNHASEALHAALGEARMAPPERLLQMQREGSSVARAAKGSLRTDDGSHRDARRRAAHGIVEPWTSTEQATTTKTMSYTRSASSTAATSANAARRIGTAPRNPPQTMKSRSFSRILTGTSSG